MNLPSSTPMMRITVLLYAILLISCDPDNGYEFTYDMVVTGFPSNLSKLNSEYDDYNSNLPYPARRLTIIYSTNRASQGSSFDFRGQIIDVSYHERDQLVDFRLVTNDGLPEYEANLIYLANSGFNELGPYTVDATDGYNYFFYANDEGGDYDIRMIYTPRLDWGTFDGQKRLFGPDSLLQINSTSDDLYPVLNYERNKLYFCSNRDGESFDIYAAEIPSESLLHEYLTDTGSVSIIRDQILSSNGNDKCPFIMGDLMVFASDRDGGFGGFDLYYSRLSDGQWGEPVNFGEAINSPSDEYRPITFTLDMEMDVMIFSSNRTGGKGGFDLYAVQIGSMISYDPYFWISK
jgi:hypothetical protein